MKKQICVLMTFLSFVSTFNTCHSTDKFLSPTSRTQLQQKFKVLKINQDSDTIEKIIPEKIPEYLKTADELIVKGFENESDKEKTINEFVDNIFNDCKQATFYRLKKELIYPFYDDDEDHDEFEEKENYKNNESLSIPKDFCYDNLIFFARPNFEAPSRQICVDGTLACLNDNEIDEFILNQMDNHLKDYFYYEIASLSYDSKEWNELTENIYEIDFIKYERLCHIIKPCLADISISYQNKKNLDPNFVKYNHIGEIKLKDTLSRSGINASFYNF
ncbi:MAG: hypothetical protein IJ730_00320 [Alphaproteobacteria bacterium]|nr:hypothetical protein [Alphaproteobacteria bacterium]